MNKESKALLDRYLASLPPERPDRPEPSESVEVFHFCSTREEADQCVELVKSGRKTATSSLAWAYEAEGVAHPRIGELSVVTDWSGAPHCIIGTTAVRVVAFDEVDAEFAHAEGEGDRSLAYWRDVHWRFFSEECAKYGLTAKRDMPLVLQAFKAVYVACIRR